MAAMANNGQKFTDKDNDAFTWSDTNGNGKMDPEEFRFYKEAAGMSLQYTAFDEHMNVYIGYQESPYYDYDGHHYLHFDFEGSVYVKLPNLAKHPGTPVWDWKYLERSKAKVPTEMREGFTGYGTRSVRCDSDGGVILYMMGSSGDRHNTWWPTASMTSAHLLRALPDGTTCWTVSKHLSPGMPLATMNGYPTYLTGVTHGCIVANDHNANYGATVWTDDGLYAGGFLDRHVAGLPDWCYEVSGHDFGYEAWLPGDDWSSGGSLTDQPDGSVMWFPPGGGRIGVYRIRGWKNWFRDSGNIQLTAPPTAAPRDTDLTSGLMGTYYRGASFAGAPVYTGTDTCLWFSSTPVSFGDPMEWPDGRVASWTAGPCPGIDAKQPFSVRWTGRVVAPLGEEFWLRVYNQFQVIEYAPLQIWKDGAGFARVWLDGVLIIDQLPGTHPVDLAQAGPLRLQAGRSYDIKIEYAYPGASSVVGGSGADFSLCWASNTLELQRVPPAYLHTDAAPSRPVVHLTAVDQHATEAHQKPGLVRFSIDSPLHQNLTVRYRLEGSADASDYLPLSGEVVIPAGATSADVIVTPVDDAICEGDETVRFILRADATYRGDGTVGAATITIADDDNRVTSGLVAYYPLDEAPATQHIPPDDPEDIVVHDRVGGHDGVFMTSSSGFPAPLPRWLPTAGKLGGALDFYDEPSRVSLPGSLIQGSDFTLALWVCTREADTQFVSSTTAQRPLFALVSGRLSVSLGATTLAPAGPRLNDGAWHHVALLWGHAKHQMAMAVDGGALVGWESGPATAQLNDLVLGTNIHTWSKSFIGALDDVRVYNRCLEPEEITTLAHMPLRRPVPNP